MRLILRWLDGFGRFAIGGFEELGRYFVNCNLFLMAGWDDPLFGDRASFLFGGGVTWNDEDLKYSLGLAAAAN